MLFTYMEAMEKMLVIQFTFIQENCMISGFSIETFVSKINLNWFKTQTIQSSGSFGCMKATLASQKNLTKKMVIIQFHT